MRNVVYILTNPGFRDLINVGITSNLQARIKRLSSAVPKPYRCFYAGKVSDGPTVIRSIRRAFKEERHGPRSDLFGVAPERIKAIIEGHKPRVVTADSRASNTQRVVSLRPNRTNSRNRSITRARVRINRARKILISDLGITNDEVLRLKRDESTTCRVHGADEVYFSGKIMSLSAAARMALGWKAANGWECWTYKGVTLAVLRGQLKW